MNAYQDSSLVLLGDELESINGGVQYSPNGEIFSAGLEMVAEGKEMMLKSSSTTGSIFGLGQTMVGGWYLVVGGTADWIGSWF